LIEAAALVKELLKLTLQPARLLFHRVINWLKFPNIIQLCAFFSEHIHGFFGKLNTCVLNDAKNADVDKPVNAVKKKCRKKKFIKSDFD
jgi:hypothetical protein